MNNTTQKLTFDQLDQVSGGWGRHKPGGWEDPKLRSVPLQSNQVNTTHYLPTNKNGDVRSYVLF